MMNEPKHILKFNEAAFKPKQNPGILFKLRPAVWIIIGIIIVASFVFGENIFGELSRGPQLLLIALAISTLLVSGDERAPKPMEIWFYDDYLVLYREHHYYSKKLSRKEYDKFYYKDIKECIYRANTQRINFYGVVEGIWYDYDANGNVSNVPSYHKTTDSIRYFYTMFADSEKLIEEIEKYAPIKIEVTNT